MISICWISWGLKRDEIRMNGKIRLIENFLDMEIICIIGC